MLVDSSEELLGGSSKLDILIATPGRLMDHLASTPNFTLQHLRFLVSFTQPCPALRPGGTSGLEKCTDFCLNI